MIKIRYKDMSVEQRREYHREANKRHCAKHHKKIQEKSRQYYAENREERQAYQRSYWALRVKPAIDECAASIISTFVGLAAQERLTFVSGLVVHSRTDNLLRMALKDFRVDAVIGAELEVALSSAHFRENAVSG